MKGYLEIIRLISSPISLFAVAHRVLKNLPAFLSLMTRSRVQIDRSSACYLCFMYSTLNNIPSYSLVTVHARIRFYSKNRDTILKSIYQGGTRVSLSLSHSNIHITYSFTRITNTRTTCACVYIYAFVMRKCAVYTRACIRDTRVQLEVYVCIYIYVRRYVSVVLITCVRERAARPRQFYVHLKKQKKKRSSYDRNSDLRHACRKYLNRSRGSLSMRHELLGYTLRINVRFLLRVFFSRLAQVFFDLLFICKVVLILFFRLRGRSSLEHIDSFEAILFKSILL